MIELIVGDFVKKVIIALLIFLGIFLFVENVKASEMNLDLINILAGEGPEAPDLELDTGSQSCEELIGKGFKALLRLFVVGVRIAAVIIAVVVAMSNFLPALMGNNPSGELQQAFKKTCRLFIVLVIVVSFPNILSLIGELFGFDLSCVF